MPVVKEGSHQAGAPQSEVQIAPGPYQFSRSDCTSAFVTDACHQIWSRPAFVMPLRYCTSDILQKHTLLACKVPHLIRGTVSGMAAAPEGIIGGVPSPPPAATTLLAMLCLRKWHQQALSTHSNEAISEGPKAPSGLLIDIHRSRSHSFYSLPRFASGCTTPQSERPCHAAEACAYGSQLSS